MRHKLPITWFVVCLFSTLVRATGIKVDVTAREHNKMSLCVVYPKDKQLKKIADIIKKDLSWSDQFAVDCLVRPPVRSTQEIKKLAHKNYSLAIFLTQKDDDELLWRLYDTSRAVMIRGKKVKRDGMPLRGWAHTCADGIWEALTGAPGSFASKIAYCKEVRKKGKRPQKHIYLVDYDGSHARALVASPTVSIAPRWNRGTAIRPLIYFSECTLRNVRLVVVALNGRKRVISNFDGLNMLVTFAPKGNKAVMCLSRGGSTQLYLYNVGSRGLERLTYDGANISPCFLDQDRIVFCSDDNREHKPHVCLMNLDTREIQELVGGYCSSPTFCSKTKKLAYTKLIKGVMQIFTYDMNRQQEQQHTFDSGSKDECCWSPCGTYLAYTLERGKSSRIAVLNLKTDKRRFVTSSSERCTYPAWAPNYVNTPFIT